MRELLLGLTTAATSLLLLAALGELVVFRVVLVASDVPRNEFAGGVVRYQAGQRGVWRVRDEIAAPFAINTQGWNSGHARYATARRPGVGRIAIVGDSYVEALQVPADRSVAELLERRLAPAPVEVFRYGMSGAPLSQYLLMIEREVVPYRPDVVVVILVHNDFDESFRLQAGRYTSSFLKLRLDDGRVSGEIQPAPYAIDWRDTLRQTATFRYLYFRERVSVGTLKRLLTAPRDYQANVDLAAVRTELAEVRVATDYLFGRLAGVARSHGFRLVLAMDGDRQAIYGGAEPPDGPRVLNRLAASLAARHGLDFVDLHEWFARDWQRAHRRFEFDADGHWNVHGHRVVADALRAVLRAAPELRLSPPAPTLASADGG